MTDDDSIASGEQLTLTFSEPVDVSNITLANLQLNSNSFGTAANGASVSQVNSGSFDNAFTVTFGSDVSLTGGETITLNSSNAVDQAGNTADTNITFNVPAATDY